MGNFMYGSICLSAVPKELFKKVMCKDGQERIFLNVKVVKRKEKSQFGHTHFISCEPKEQSERVEGTNYIIGDMTEHEQQGNAPSPEEVASAPAADANALPF